MALAAVRNWHLALRSFAGIQRFQLFQEVKRWGMRSGACVLRTQNTSRPLHVVESFEIFIPWPHYQILGHFDDLIAGEFDCWVFEGEGLLVV